LIYRMVAAVSAIFSVGYGLAALLAPEAIGSVDQGLAKAIGWSTIAVTVTFTVAWAWAYASPGEREPAARGAPAR
jgi:hypothetical protein